MHNTTDTQILIKINKYAMECLQKIGERENYLQQNAIGYTTLNLNDAQILEILSPPHQKISWRNPLAFEYMGILHYLNSQYHRFCYQNNVHSSRAVQDAITLLLIVLTKMTRASLIQESITIQLDRLYAQKEFLQHIQQDVLVFQKNPKLRFMQGMISNLEQLFATLQTKLYPKSNKNSWATLNLHSRQSFLRRLSIVSAQTDTTQIVASTTNTSAPKIPWGTRLKQFLQTCIANLKYFFQRVPISVFRGKSGMRKAERSACESLATAYLNAYAINRLPPELPSVLNLMIQTPITCPEPDTVCHDIECHELSHFTYIKENFYVDHALKNSFLGIAQETHRAHQHFLKQLTGSSQSVISRFLAEMCNWAIKQYHSPFHSDALYQIIRKRMRYLQLAKQHVFFTAASIERRLGFFISQLDKRLGKIAVVIQDERQEAQRWEVRSLFKTFQTSRSLLSWGTIHSLLVLLSDNPHLKIFFPTYYAGIVQHDAAFRRALAETYLGQLLPLLYATENNNSLQPCMNLTMTTGIRPHFILYPKLLKVSLAILRIAFQLNDSLHKITKFISDLTVNTTDYRLSAGLTQDFRDFFQAVEQVQYRIEKKFQTIQSIIETKWGVNHPPLQPSAAQQIWMQHILQPFIKARKNAAYYHAQFLQKRDSLLQGISLAYDSLDTTEEAADRYHVLQTTLQNLTQQLLKADSYPISHHPISTLSKHLLITAKCERNPLVRRGSIGYEAHVQPVKCTAPKPLLRRHSCGNA